MIVVVSYSTGTLRCFVVLMLLKYDNNPYQAGAYQASPRSRSLYFRRGGHRSSPYPPRGRFGGPSHGGRYGSGYERQYRAAGEEEA